MLFATYFFEVGLLLLIIPWSSFWDRNLLLEVFPLVYDATRSAFVRGAISGLGVLNIGAGITELAMAWAAPASTPSDRLLTPRIDDPGRERA